MGMRFDEAFYEQAGIPFEARWASFAIPRDPEAEAEVFREIAPKARYIFVHDDPSRGFVIDEARLPKDVLRFRPERGQVGTVFGYRKVIEEADEVHCISSSFANYLECAPSGRPQYLHHYSRIDGTWSTWRNFQVLE